MWRTRLGAERAAWGSPSPSPRSTQGKRREESGSGRAARILHGSCMALWGARAAARRTVQQHHGAAWDLPVNVPERCEGCGVGEAPNR